MTALAPPSNFFERNGTLDHAFHVLLSKCDYSQADVDAQMSWLRTKVFPILAEADPEVPSLCSPNGCPIEPSVNFTSNGTVVRFTMEPLALQGPDLDHREVVSSIQPLLYGVPEVDTRWFEQLIQTIMITPKEEAELKGSLPPHLPRPQRYFLGFDLVGGTRNVKCYVFPAPVVRSGKIVPSATRVFDAVRSLDPLGKELGPAVDELQSFLHSLSIPWSVQLVSMDLRDPVQGLLCGNGSRIKIYAATAENSWSVVRNFITLGGRRKDHATIEGLDHLANIWNLLLNEPDGILGIPGKGEDWNKSGRMSSLGLGVLYSFDIVPGSPLPEVKVQVPIFDYARSAESIIHNIEQVFETQQWSWWERGRFEELIREAL